MDNQPGNPRIRRTITHAGGCYVCVRFTETSLKVLIAMKPEALLIAVLLFTAPSIGQSPTAEPAVRLDHSVALASNDIQQQNQPSAISQQQKPSEQLPNAPSSSKTEPSLEDLGFSKADTQADAQRQALLDKRTHMLKIHQRLGLIAAIPVTAAVLSSVGAGGKDTSSSSRDLHVALGSLASDLYFTAAYFAIRAPRVPGTKAKGPIRFHKAMAWIHGPGMIATPILGIMAFDQKNKGEKVHGIAQAHGPVAIVTAGAFGAALLSVSVKF